MINAEYSLTLQRAAEPAPCGEITAELFYQWTDYIDGSERTKQTYTGNIKRFSDWLRVNGIRQPERPDILRYRDELSKKYKPATVHGYLIAVKLFFQWAEQAGIYPDIAKRIKSANVDPYYKKDPLTGKQAAKVLDNINEDTAAGLRDYALISLMLTTGLRTHSIILADIGDIRTLGEYTVLYYQGKGHEEKAEFVKLSEPVLKAIQRYLQSRGAEPAPNEPLFASVAHRNAGKRMTTRSISRIIKNALKAAGLESDRLTAHSLRHTAANLAIKNGAPLREVQQLLGHKNINITMIYLEQIKRTENTSTDRITAAIFG
ncbi:MAG: tyrosine-type recombinase/integrase [Methanobrevibacter sp.]|nr:tyrosine-type recombinase/integrase [Methanobrevibacter sp.]